MKYEYSFLNFNITETQDIEDWTNRKGNQGFKIINIHYYTLENEQFVRIAMELNNQFFKVLKGLNYTILKNPLLIDFPNLVLR